MKPQLTFFYTDECIKCATLKPIISEFKNKLGIKMVNTYENELITESFNIEWVPTLVIEDKNIVLGDVATPTNTTADGGVRRFPAGARHRPR